MKHKTKIPIIAAVTLLIAVPVNFLLARVGKPPRPDQMYQEIIRQKQLNKAQRDATIQKLEKKVAPLMDYTVEELQVALTVKVIGKYGGARIISDERRPQYLGTVCDEFDSESVFNEFQNYGSPFNAQSIWNEYGNYGGFFPPQSPFNPTASNPPLIMKENKVLGRLTINGTISGAVDPHWLKQFFKY